MCAVLFVAILFSLIFAECSKGKALTGNTDDRIQAVFSYIDKKEYSEALDVCNRMLEKGPGNAVAYGLRSRVNNHLEKYDANGRRWEIKKKIICK